MTMNENHSLGFGMETGKMDVESKEIYELNDSSRDISEAKGSDECWSRKVINELSVDDANVTVEFPRKEGQNGFSHDLEKDADPLPSKNYDEEKEPISWEAECLTAFKKHTDYNETEGNLFADKTVLDCDMPELEVCYKEIDHHHTVKDICVDEGKPEKAKEEGFDKEILALDEEHRTSDEEKETGLDSHSNTTSTTDTSKCDHVEELVPTGDAATTDSTKENSLLDEKIPLEEFGAQSLIKSSFESLDGVENAVKQWPAKIADKDAVSQSLAIALANEEQQQEVVQQSVDSGDVHNRKDKIVDNISDDAHESEDNESHLENKAQIASNDGAKTVEADAAKHESWTTPENPSVVGQMQKDEGETSFSAASLINYSEPVPFSGSISHRSDSSATSARSFAFPVLQSEWNSSPVRMAKADRRHLRKHRCWRSGLFCCKF